MTSFPGTAEPQCPLCHRAWPEADPDFTDRARAQGLTARESDVLHLIGNGLANEEIAARLYLSINSVKSYIRSAYRRLGVTSRSHAVLWANGLEVRRDDVA